MENCYHSFLKTEEECTFIILYNVKLSILDLRLVTT